MIDLYILDKNLEAVGIIDAYRSLIWAKRYKAVGDCEIYTVASAENIALLQEGFYIVRTDDDMVCQIRKVEIDTDAEEGNYIVATGYDVKGLLDQRIVWGTMTCDGNLESFIRTMVEDSICSPDLTVRKMLKEDGSQLMYLGASAGFTESLTEQISYKNIGEKVREFCTRYGWGYKVELDSGNLYFSLYKGEDRSGSVIFSDEFENLSSTKYVDDRTKMGNVAFVGGAGEGPERSVDVYGAEPGIDRFEIFVDAKDIARQITYEALTSIYPLVADGGEGYIESSGDGYVYKMQTIDIQIVDAGQLSWLQTNFPGGTVVTVDGQDFYRVANPAIADLPSDDPAPTDSVTLADIVYKVYLLNRGSQNTAKYGQIRSFEGTVIPDITFVYKQDYFLGDIVTVENEYGISANVRISEIVEVMDENGYKLEPAFEQLSLS